MNESADKNLEGRSNDAALACFTAFCCSLVSLGLELVLSRVALTSFGSTALASTATITIYLCGLTVGALLAQNTSQKRRAIRISATALAAAPLLSLGLMQFLANSTLTSLASYLLLALALLLPSTSSAALVSLLATRHLSDTSNRIYLAANLGAFSGAVLTGFVILPYLRNSDCLIALFAIMIPATICSWCFKHKNSEEEIYERATDLAAEKSTFVILFSTALLLTVLECDWLRFSSLLLGSSSQTFAATLAAIIGALALGNFFGLKLSKNKKEVAAAPVAALTLSTLACLLSLKTVAALPIIFQYLRIYFQQFAPINEVFLAVPQLLSTTLLVMPTAACIGLIYPLYTRSLSSQQWRKAYTVSSAGAIVGPTIFLLVVFITSLELVLKFCIVSLALLTAMESLKLRTKNKTSRPIALAFLTGSILALLISFVSPPLNKRMLTAGMAYLPATPLVLEQVKQEGQNLDLLFYKDGMNSTISVEESKLLNVRFLKSDGKVEATIPIEKSKPANGSDLGTQTMLCLVPALVHGGENLNCLIIGLGSGTTSSTAKSLEQIKHVDIVELETAVLFAAQCFGNFDIKNSKMHHHSDDARAHLMGKQTYDLIISQPSEPWVAGSSSLFTVEFFRLMRQRLNSDGLVAQWLPLYGLSKSDFLCALRTFTVVFPDTLIFHQKGAGELLLIGANNAKSLAQIDSIDYKSRFLSQVFRKETALAGFDSWNTFAQSHLLRLEAAKPLRAFLSANAEINSDNNMRLEYSSGRYLANTDGANEKQIEANLAMLENNWQGQLDTEPKNDASLTAAIKQDPSSYLLLNLKAKKLLIAGEAELALDYLNRSRLLNPSIEETRELLALALVSRGKLMEGLQETQTAHLLNHQSCLPYLIAACIYQIDGNSAEARSNFEKAKQICPENEILNQIAGLEINTAGILKSILIRL